MKIYIVTFIDDIDKYGASVYLVGTFESREDAADAIAEISNDICNDLNSLVQDHDTFSLAEVQEKFTITETELGTILPVTTEKNSNNDINVSTPEWLGGYIE